MKNYKPQIYCGDYRNLLKDVRVDLIFTSPPYNIGSKCPRRDGFRKLGKYDPKSYGAIEQYFDELPEEQYQNEQEMFLVWCADHLSSNGILAYNHKPRRKDSAMIHPAEWFTRVRNKLTLMEEVIWFRGSTHNHSNRLMWPTTERIYVFRRCEDSYKFLNHSGLPQRSDLWAIAPTNDGNASFPVSLVDAAIKAWSQPGGLVCDPYSGIGTVALRAHVLGRRFIGTEIDVKRHQQAIVRLSDESAAAA